MRTVRIHKAQRFSAQKTVESVTIELHDELPYESGEGRLTVEERFVSDARALRDALRCLPGGTADQLLRLLLEDRASLLVVQRPVEGESRGDGSGDEPRAGVPCGHSPSMWADRLGPGPVYCAACQATIKQREDGRWYVFIREEHPRP